MSVAPLRGRRRDLVLLALVFALGALADSTLSWRLSRNSSPAVLAPVTRPDRPVHGAIGSPVEKPGADGSGATGTTGTAGGGAVEQLRNRGLAVPVQGVKRSELHDTFTDRRGSARAHEAIDIMAPRRTPVVAVQDGRIVKLFTSQAGGLTIYQFDPSETFCYYYAHLDGYADSLREGETVSAGQLLGYVGSSGNASPDAPHLHFAIFRLTPERQWWKGEPIDPYPVLR